MKQALCILFVQRLSVSVVYDPAKSTVARMQTALAAVDCAARPGP